jgi:mannose-6-phosphate isomerase
MGTNNGQNGHMNGGGNADGVTTNGNGVNTRKSVVGLIPSVKDYAWGIRGMDSRVARYALESKALDEVDPDCPYAELWIGTHPKGPSRLKTGELLRDAIGDDLPFLFKVLSAGKALSIQAHPDKDNARRLNIEDPDNYGDDNHKPEMAIALTPFEAMCGFRRLEEISFLIKKHPEFAACISQEAKLAIFLAQNPLSQKEALRMLFSSFMTCDPDVSSEQLKLLLLRLQAEQSQLHPHPHDEPAWYVYFVFVVEFHKVWRTIFRSSFLHSFPHFF